VSAVLVLIEHDRGEAPETAYQALAFAQRLTSGAVEAVTIGADADGLAATLGRYGAGKVWQIHHDELSDYAPEAWGDALAQVMAAAAPGAVVACGTDRGNEVLAHLAAMTDMPLATNVVGVAPAPGDEGGNEGKGLALTRLRWGGSLLEDATLRASVLLMTCAPHAFAADDLGGPPPVVEVLAPTLDSAAAMTRIVDRVPVAAGATLATAAVVVSGGRGVGSPEGFALLEELAGLLGGAVGCSRVATNNGWRPHSDQVGQTGKRIAPDLYVACGISGAIQHWVGMMAAKRVLAINIDPEAPMVTKADYAVIGDLHEILKAVVSEIRERRS
jgi:electron transfer flavoprotein alpha subunit